MGRDSTLLPLIEFLPVVKRIWTDPCNRGERTLRTLYLLTWQSLKGLLRDRVICETFNGKKIIISAGVMYYRVYEARYTDFVLKHVERGGTLVDVGADVGRYALQISDLFTRIFCYEPSHNVHRLLANFYLNHGRIPMPEVHNIAVSDVCGEIKLFIPPRSVPRIALPDDPIESVSSVKCATLDNTLNDVRDIRLLKIDVEGHELYVLRGAQETLARNPAALLHVECFGPKRELSTLLAKSKFRLFALDVNDQPSKCPSILDASTDVFAAGPAHRLYSRLG